MGNNADVVRSAYSAFGRGDVPGVLELLDDDVQWSSPRTLPQGGIFRGRAGAGEFFQGIGTAWESLGLQVDTVDELGESLVVGVVRGEGRLRTGKPAHYGAVHLFTVAGGRIEQFREYVDVDAALG